MLRQLVSPRTASLFQRALLARPALALSSAVRSYSSSSSSKNNSKYECDLDSSCDSGSKQGQVSRRPDRERSTGTFDDWFDHPWFSHHAWPKHFYKGKEGKDSDRNVWDRYAQGNRAWRPKATVSETDSAVIINAELPGLSKEDVTLNVEDDVLTISGEINVEEKADGSVSSFHKSYARAFALPDGVDESAISAKMEHGLLTINIPKTKTTRKGITINIE